MEYTIFDNKWTYDDFKSIYSKKPDYFQKKSGQESDSGAKYDYYGLSRYTEQDTGFKPKQTALSTSLFNKFKKQYDDDVWQENQRKQAAQVNAQGAAQNQYQASQTSAQASAASQAATNAEIARIQEQLAQQVGVGQGQSGTPQVTTEQLVANYQKQMQDYQAQLANSQNTLFSQLAKQQEEQQTKATNMFAGYQQYTDQLRGEWQQGLSQTRDLIGSLQSGYQAQLQGLQGIFDQSLNESRNARQAEADDRARIQGLLQEQARAAQTAKENQERFQQSADMVAQKKSQDLGRSFNRASSQATFGVLSNLRRRGGASQAVFGDGTTSQNPYGYSNIFFS